MDKNEKVLGLCKWVKAVYPDYTNQACQKKQQAFGVILKGNLDFENMLQWKLQELNTFDK